MGLGQREKQFLSLKVRAADLAEELDAYRACLLPGHKLSNGSVIERIRKLCETEDARAFVLNEEWAAQGDLIDGLIARDGAAFDADAAKQELKERMYRLAGRAVDHAENHLGTAGQSASAVARLLDTCAKLVKEDDGKKEPVSKAELEALVKVAKGEE